MAPGPTAFNPTSLALLSMAAVFGQTDNTNFASIVRTEVAKPVDSSILIGRRLGFWKCVPFSPWINVTFTIEPPSKPFCRSAPQAICTHNQSN